MSDSLQFTKIIQDELRAMRDRTQQIETMLQMNVAGMAMITDLVHRHPALHVVVETGGPRGETPDVGAYEVVKQTPEAPVQRKPGDVILPQHNLKLGAFVHDVSDNTWEKVDDQSRGQQLFYALNHLFRKYASPKLAVNLPASILCRGFIQADVDKIYSDIDLKFRPCMLDINSFVERDKTNAVVLCTDTVMALLQADRNTGFYTISGAAPDNIGLWLVINCKDTFIIFDLYAGDEAYFVSMYINDNVDVTVKYVDTVMHSVNNQLYALAMESMNIFK